MPAHGTMEPLAYMLGEAPGHTEDRRGRPFVGEAGQVLRMRLPDWANDDTLRWNNVVRTRPTDNRTPNYIEMECCRPSIESDILMTRPPAIFGFGNVPLAWALGETGISTWNGRRVPLRVGSKTTTGGATHDCWFFPMLHPSYILRGRKWTPSSAEDYGSDIEYVFAKDLERAFASIDNLPVPVVHTHNDVLDGIETVDGSRSGDVERVLAMLDHCYEAKVVGYDYETKGLRPYGPEAKLLSCGLSTKDRTMGFALRHKQAGWTPAALERVEQALEDFVYESDCRKVVHHLAFEQEWTAYFMGKRSLRAGLWGDTLGQAFVLDERRGGLSLEFLCMQYFGVNIKAVVPDLDKNRLDDAPIGKVLVYQGIDARYHRLLYAVQHKRLHEDGTYDYYRHHLRRVPTMVLTQLKGIPVHQPTVRKFFEEWEPKRAAAEAAIAKLPLVQKYKDRYGKDFRVSATTDIKKALAMIGAKPESMDEEHLKPIKHKLVDHILAWREANKILSTYVEPVGDGLVDSKGKALPRGKALWPDGRMHPLTTLHKTRTSRTASEDTNYQNWPKREHKEIRSQVTVDKGWKLCSFDYGQIQARNVAMESADEALVEAFWQRYDIHHDWTEQVIDVWPKWMDDKGGWRKAKEDKGIWKYYRDRTKNEFVFPSFFGAQPPKLASYLEIPEDRVRILVRRFWDKFPSIHAWQQNLMEDYYRDGYTTSLAGHRRHAPVSVNEIINAPIQADEAIIVCDAMSRLSELEQDRYQANMEIHDDLTFIWPADEVEENAITVIDYMINVPFEWAHIVPIVVEFSIGDDWGAKTDVGTYASDLWKPSMGLGIDRTKALALGIG